MNNEQSFFNCVVRPVLVIIGFLIGLGVIMTAKGDTLTEIKDYSIIESLEDKISRIESVINKDNNLRRLYHGGIPTYTYETNLTEETVQRIDKYPDGYIHIEKGQKRPLMTPEKLAKMEVAKKKLKSSRIDRLKERIETLSKSTNAVDAATLSKCKRLLERLERSSTTNYIDIVVTPQSK